MESRSTGVGRDPCLPAERESTKTLGKMPGYYSGIYANNVNIMESILFIFLVNTTWSYYF